MIIDIKQINNAELTTFIANAVSGSVFSGNMASYYLGSGYFGNYVLYTTGASQIVNGPITFNYPIEVPYTGDTGAATPYLLVLNMVNSGLATYYLQVTGNTVTLSGNDIVGGYKTFTGQLQLLATPTLSNSAINLAFLTGVSGVLATSAGTSNVVLLTTNQLITGVKTFVSIPGSLGTPVNPTDLATKSYVDNSSAGSANSSNIVTTSGLNQNLSGTYNYTNLLTVPIATNPLAPPQLAQLNALGTVFGGITGFGGVVAINGTSGASGQIYLVGAGSTQVIQCGPIFYISGLNGNSSTQIYASKIPLNAATTGLQINFNTGFTNTPVIVGNLEASGGGGSIAFIDWTVYNVTTGGFGVAFQSGIPNGTPNYYFDFTAMPFLSGTGGFVGLQGAQGGLGPSINARGIWQQAQMYAVYDVVYNPPYNASFLCYVQNISTTVNAPGGTGNSNWVIFSSGAQGASGIWNGYYNWTTGQIFAYGNTTVYNGSSYGYTGAISESGAPPNTGANWVLLAQQGGIGYFINSGTITGGFVNMSFFLNPVNTGLNLAEAFVGSNFIVTGFALGCVASGTGLSNGGYPGPLSGDFYTRDLNNNKNVIQNFTFNSGIYTYISGGISLNVTGYWRIGIDLTNTLGGIQNFSVGIFGFSLT